MNTQHTPTRLRVAADCGTTGRPVIYDEHGNKVATVWRGIGGKDHEYAAHIVRCVNSHDALLEALRWMVNAYGKYASTPKENRCYPTTYEVNSYQRQAMDAARAALTGEQS